MRSISPRKLGLFYCPEVRQGYEIPLGMRQRLHARDAVGPLKNGIHIIANDYEVAVAA